MKYTILLVSILWIPFKARAQDTEKNFQLGFTASPNLSWITSDSKLLEPKAAKVGFSYGVIADFGFARNYFFSTAFTVTSLNTEAERPGVSTDRYKLQYIELPLTLKLKSNPVASHKFYGQFGLGTGVNISAKKDVIAPSSQVSDNVSISSDVNALRLALIAGAGVEWSAGRNLNVVTGVTVNNGFTKIFEGYNSKNPSITLNLGIFF